MESMVGAETLREMPKKKAQVPEIGHRMNPENDSKTPLPWKNILPSKNGQKVYLTSTESLPEIGAGFYIDITWKSSNFS
jgi:hypothetical protein